MIVDQFSDWFGIKSPPPRPKRRVETNKRNIDINIHGRVLRLVDDHQCLSFSSGEMRSQDIKVVKTTTGLQLY